MAGALGGPPATNVIEVAGDTLTDTALNEAISIIEDMELTVKTIVMRGRPRFAKGKGQRSKDELKRGSCPLSFALHPSPKARGGDERPTVEAAREMAKRFNVSGQAMQIRLEDLKLILPEKPEPYLFSGGWE